MSDYNTLSDSVDTINNGLLHDIHLKPTKDINLHPGLSTMFNNTQEYAVKGIQEKSIVSETFFSNQNIEVNQSTIRYNIYKNTNQIIDKQSPNELIVVMRSVFLQYGNAILSSDNVINEIQKLNNIVVEFCTGQVNTQLKQYNGYLEKMKTLPVPMEHPKYLNKNNFTFDSSNLMS
jgi:predicted PilT family ATPase